MLPLDQQSVAVDGEAIRSIREQKRLTQFYVSKVVGVTTDTVSRWENNRYPTIKRENAIKLAEALEVELVDILKRELPVSGAADQPPERSGRLKWIAGVGLFLSGCVVLWFVVLQNNHFVASQLHAERNIPAHAAPGSQFLVQLTVAADPPLNGLVLKETFPAGLHFISAEPAATSIDRERGVVRWIFRQPVLPLQIFYRLEVSRDHPLGSTLAVAGEVVTNPDGQPSVVPIEAVGQISIEPLHWADNNANMIIDDLEILAFSELLEQTTLFDEEWDRLEELWHAGGYSWDQENFQFRPVSNDSLHLK